MASRQWFYTVQSEDARSPAAIRPPHGKEQMGRGDLWQDAHRGSKQNGEGVRRSSILFRWCKTSKMAEKPGRYKKGEDLRETRLRVGGRWETPGGQRTSSKGSCTVRKRVPSEGRREVEGSPSCHQLWNAPYTWRQGWPGGPGGRGEGGEGRPRTWYTI